MSSIEIWLKGSCHCTDNRHQEARQPPSEGHDGVGGSFDLTALMECKGDDAKTAVSFRDLSTAALPDWYKIVAVIFPQIETAVKSYFWTSRWPHTTERGKRR